MLWIWIDSIISICVMDLALGLTSFARLPFLRRTIPTRSKTFALAFGSSRHFLITSKFPFYFKIFFASLVLLTCMYMLCPIFNFKKFSDVLLPTHIFTFSMIFCSSMRSKKFLKEKKSQFHMWPLHLPLWIEVKLWNATDSNVIALSVCLRRKRRPPTNGRWRFIPI